MKTCSERCASASDIPEYGGEAMKSETVCRGRLLTSQRQDTLRTVSGLAKPDGKHEQLILPPRRPAANQQQTAPPLPKAGHPPAQLPPDTLAIYTDGSGPDRHEVAAGWGFTVVTGGDGEADNAATEVHSRCGHVVTDTQDARYLGAERAERTTPQS